MGELGADLSEFGREDANDPVIRALLFSDSSVPSPAVSLSPSMLSSSESRKEGSGAHIPESLRSCQGREEVAGSAVLFLFGGGGT